MSERPPPLHIRVFLSSPGDVTDERSIALQVLPGVQTVSAETDVETLDPATISEPSEGLEAFQQNDATIFFGHGEPATKQVERLRNGQAFLAIVRASGRGKRSLVRGRRGARTRDPVAVCRHNTLNTTQIPPRSSSNTPFVDVSTPVFALSWKYGLETFQA